MWFFIFRTIMFDKIPGRTARPGNGRFRLIPVILWKQHSERKFFGFFPINFRPVPSGKYENLVGIHPWAGRRKNFRGGNKIVSDPYKIFFYPHYNRYSIFSEPKTFLLIFPALLLAKSFAIILKALCKYQGCP
jgi:hypothetical protein